MIIRLFCLTALMFFGGAWSHLTLAQQNLKVVTYNTHGGHGDLEGNLKRFRDLLEGDEQVLCLQELNPDIWEQVKAAFPEFPHTFGVWQKTTAFGARQWGGGGVLSKQPIVWRNSRLIQIDPGGDRWERKAAFVRIQTGATARDNVFLAHYHNTYNWNENDFESEQEGMRKFRDITLEEMEASSLGVDRPYVLAGDFNLFEDRVWAILDDAPYHYGVWRDHIATNIPITATRRIDTSARDISDHDAVVASLDHFIERAYPDAGAILSERYAIFSRHSEKVVDVEGPSSDNGANVHQWSYVGGDNQHFDIREQSDGSYSIRAVHSGKSLDVYQSSMENGGDIRQWSWWGGDNQRWIIEPVGDGYYKITSALSGKSLDVSGAGSGNGNNIIQWDYHGGANQQWYFQPVD